MPTADVIRKVQRQIGDDNEILISQDDIVDYINEGQKIIARETLYRTTTTTAAASEFRDGETVSDMIILERIYYGTRPLALVDKETIDRMDLAELTDGIPQAYYRQGTSIYLFPTPASSDATTVTVHYVDLPTTLTSEASPLDIPALYEDDLVIFCKARANERNENFRAASEFMSQFMSGLAQRKYEAQSQDDSFYTVGPDYEDYEPGYYDSL